MMAKTRITDLQGAKIIIDTVGEPYQSKAVDMLQSLTYIPAEYEPSKSAQDVIRNMTNEYMLNVANVLWSNRKTEILQKTWISEAVSDAGSN